MSKLITIIAKIELFAGEYMRKTPFVSGYRPVFDFVGARTKISGKIDLLDMNLFYPGSSAKVQISFNKDMISDSHFKIGETFTFGEGVLPLGKGEIINVLNI